MTAMIAISASDESHPKLPGLTWLKLEMPQATPVRCCPPRWLQTPVAQGTHRPGCVSIFREGGRAVGTVRAGVREQQAG